MWCMCSNHIHNIKLKEIGFQNGILPQFVVLVEFMKDETGNVFVQISNIGKIIIRLEVIAS